MFFETSTIIHIIKGEEIGAETIHIFSMKK